MIIVLKWLATFPDYRGLGAASQILQWGFTQADELGLPAYLEASKEGALLYEKRGLEKVGNFVYRSEAVGWRRPVGGSFDGEAVKRRGCGSKDLKVNFRWKRLSMNISGHSLPLSQFRSTPTYSPRR